MFPNAFFLIICIHNFHECYTYMIPCTAIQCVLSTEVSDVARNASLSVTKVYQYCMCNVILQTYKPAKKEDIHAPPKNIGDLKLQEKVSDLFVVYVYVCVCVYMSVCVCTQATDIHFYTFMC